MASKTVRTMVALLTANTIWMNSALAVVSEKLQNSEITERQHCTVFKKSTNTTLDAVCGYKTDVGGRRVKYREFYDQKIDRVIQQYQISPAVFDAQGKKTKDAVFEELKIQLETAPAAPGMTADEVRNANQREAVEQQQQPGRYAGPPVDLFPRPDRRDELDQKMSTGTKVLLVSGAVIGVIGLGYGYKMIRKSGKRAGAPATQLSQKTLKAIDAAPKTVKFPKGSPFAGKQVSIKGHLPASQVPKGARRFRTSGNREVVVYQDPYSNNLLTYMIWHDMFLSHPISYGQPIHFSGSNAAVPMMAETQSPKFRGTNESTFAEPTPADIARPSIGTSSDFVVAARVESDRVVTSSESDYSNGVSEPAPPPRESSCLCQKRS